MKKVQEEPSVTFDKTSKGLEETSNALEIASNPKFNVIKAFLVSRN
jgi:hypothetical protein